MLFYRLIDVVGDCGTICRLEWLSTTIDKRAVETTDESLNDRLNVAAVAPQTGRTIPGIKQNPCYFTICWLKSFGVNWNATNIDGHFCISTYDKIYDVHETSYIRVQLRHNYHFSTVTDLKFHWQRPFEKLSITAQRFTFCLEFANI